MRGQTIKTTSVVWYHGTAKLTSKDGRRRRSRQQASRSPLDRVTDRHAEGIKLGSIFASKSTAGFATRLGLAHSAAVAAVAVDRKGSALLSSAARQGCQRLLIDPSCLHNIASLPYSTLPALELAAAAPDPVSGRRLLSLSRFRRRKTAV